MVLPILIPMAIGATVGAATNRNPLKGAALGAGMGAAGGAMGGLLGGGASQAASGSLGAAAQQGATNVAAGMGASPGALPSAASMGFGGQQAAGGGLLSTFGDKLQAFNAAAHPYAQAASIGQQAAGLLSPQQEPLASAPPPQPVSSGPQALAEIAQGQPNPLIQRRQEAMARRRMMGGY